jgi:hypothetical protein
MKRTATYLTSAALGTMLLATSSAAWAQMEVPLVMLGMSLLANSGSLPAPSAAPAAATAPLMTGRSVATGQFGNSCSTHVKTCDFRHASYVGHWLLMPRAGRPRQRLRDTVNLHVDGGKIGIQAWPGQTRPLPWRGLNSNPEIIAVQTLV